MAEADAAYSRRTGAAWAHVSTHVMTVLPGVAEADAAYTDPAHGDFVNVLLGCAPKALEQARKLPRPSSMHAAPFAPVIVGLSPPARPPAAGARLCCASSSFNTLAC